MKLNKLVRNTMMAGLGAGLALTVTSCSRDYTSAYLYATSANGTGGTGASITAYAVDYESGIPTQIDGSPFSTNMGNPIASIPSPNNKVLYLIGGSQNAAVEVINIGSDGKLYGATSNNSITGTYPTAAAIDSTGTFLFVTYRYQNGYGPASPGPGGLSVFPINSDGSLGTAVNFNLVNPSNPSGYVVPVSVAVTVPVSSLNNAVYVYVVDQEASPNAVLLQYQFSSSGTTPTLTPTGTNPTSGVTGTIAAGVTPTAVISDPTGRFVYVADKTSNQIYGYSILGSGLKTIQTGPYTTGLYPVAMTIDPRGKYLYTVNYNSNNVSGYTIDPSSGSLGGIVGTTSFTTGTGPTCVVVEPSAGIYLYTSNYLDNSVSGAQLTPEDGSLKAVANTPFPASNLPVCVTAVPNGSHADSLVYPQ